METFFLCHYVHNLQVRDNICKSSLSIATLADFKSIFMNDWEYMDTDKETKLQY